jgi:hypothetical protein
MILRFQTFNIVFGLTRYRTPRAAHSVFICFVLSRRDAEFTDCMKAIFRSYISDACSAVRVLCTAVAVFMFGFRIQCGTMIKTRSKTITRPAKGYKINISFLSETLHENTSMFFLSWTTILRSHAFVPLPRSRTRCTSRCTSRCTRVFRARTLVPSVKPK